MNPEHAPQETRTDGLNVLRIDASGRHEASVTRSLTSNLIAALAAEYGRLEVVERDLAVSAPGFVTETWIEATFTAAEERHAAHRAALRESDELVSELMDADLVVIATPVYNFSIPAALKAWIDMVARAQRTFRYTENGPEGLVKGKRAIIVVASGGTPVGSDADFATPYLRHVLGFLGISDIEIVAADRLQLRGAGALDAAVRDAVRLAHAAPGRQKAA